MITNPLFAPQNQRAQYSSGMPSSLAYALMPTDNFAQKRADSQAAVQYQSMLMGLADQAAAEKEKSLLETQKSLELIDNQAILGPDMRRLNQSLTERWRKDMEDEIVNKYGGDIVRWKRERQPYHVMVHNRELAASPDFQRALENKTNYAQAQEAKAKGKLIVGDFDSEWANYVSGKSNALNFRGAYDAPKQVFDYFDKTPHGTNPYGINGKPVAVSQSDLAGHLLSQGLSGDQAIDYMGKIGYNGGKFWKREQQQPWDAEKTLADQGWRQQQMGFQREKFKYEQGQDKIQNNLAQQRIDKTGAGAAGANGTPTIVTELFGDNGFNNRYAKRVDGQVIYSKAGPKGKEGEALIRAAGINPVPTPGSEYATAQGQRKLLQSNLTKVFSTDLSQEYNAKPIGENPQNIMFESVNPGELLKLGKRRFITAVARINGQKKKVAVEINDDEFTRGELTNNGGVYNTKDEQRQYNINEEELPIRRLKTSLSRDVTDFNN